MKKIICLIIILLINISYAQKKTDKENKQDNPDKKENKITANLPEGYSSIKWGTLLSKAREGISGKLVFTDEKTIIISKDGELEYHYGFFYVDPAVVGTDEKNKDKEAAPTGVEQKDDEGKLFYVALKFPYLAMQDVRKKIEEKYGPSTNENLHNNQGAVGWNGDKTIVIMWVDRYENKPYCRRIIYVSKDIAKELDDYVYKMFNKVEIDLIKKLNKTN